LSSSFLSGPAAAGGIALVNVMFTGVGGFLGPFIVGTLKQQTGNYAAGMMALAAGLMSSVVLVLLLGRVIAARRVRIA
jgi:ACS family tartrate transporter-like MFS transporter